MINALTVLPRRVLAAGGAAAIAALTTGAAVAAATPAAAASQPATIRVAHLSPDMPGVDIYVRSFTGSNAVYLKDATYGDIGRYEQVPAGTYTFTLRPHGASPTSAPLQTWSLTAKPGYAYTAAEVGSGSHHQGVVLDDNLTPPAKDDGRVRFIQASSRAGDADVSALGGPLLARDAAFATSTGYASVKAKDWTLKATGGGQSTTHKVDVPAGSVTSIVLLDAPGHGIRLEDSLDAAGPAHAPRGSINAGGGGTADRGGASLALPIVGGAGGTLVIALGAVAVTRRRGGAVRP